MKSFLPAVAVCLGIVMLAGSALWSVLFPATRTWTDEKSTQMSQIAGEASKVKLTMIEAEQNPRMHGGHNAADLKTKYDGLKSQYDELYAEFTSARDSPKTASSLLRWSGIAFVAGGALVVFASRRS